MCPKSNFVTPGRYLRAPLSLSLLPSRVAAAVAACLHHSIGARCAMAAFSRRSCPWPTRALLATDRTSIVILLAYRFSTCRLYLEPGKIVVLPLRRLCGISPHLRAHAFSFGNYSCVNSILLNRAHVNSVRFSANGCYHKCISRQNRICTDYFLIWNFFTFNSLDAAFSTVISHVKDKSS